MPAEIDLSPLPWEGPWPSDEELNEEDAAFGLTENALLALSEAWIFDDPIRREACFRSGNADQIALWAIWLVAGEIQNGGITQVLTNSMGELAEEAVAGFRRFGLHTYADILDEAFDKLERPIPRLRAARWKMLADALGVKLGEPDKFGMPEGLRSCYSKAVPLLGEFTSRYFKVSKAEGNLFVALAHTISTRKDSFFSFELDDGV